MRHIRIDRLHQRKNKRARGEDGERGERECERERKRELCVSGREGVPVQPPVTAVSE